MALPDALFWTFIKEAVKAVLSYALKKNGKWDRARITTLTVWLFFAYIIYILPSLVPLVTKLGGNSSPKWLQLYAQKLTQVDYLELSQVFYLLAYVLVSVLVALYRNASEQQSLDELSENDLKIRGFLHDVQLVNFIRCSSDDERIDAAKLIAEKIEKSQHTRIMVIHGYDDLVRPDSPIRKALLRKARNLNLKVLLLDPFSSYAVDRAKQLRQETDYELTKMRYIRDHVRVTESLDEMRKKAASVEYRIYCSNPFFRLYLFDRDLIFQTYQANKHGKETPLYNFAQSERSLFSAGKEIFDYYWNKGFLHTNQSLKEMGVALTIYLCRMYQLLEDKDLPNNIDAVRAMVLSHVDQQRRTALKLDEDGKLTELDH